MAATVQPPSSAELAASLGPAEVVWTEIVEVLGKQFSPLNTKWQPSKLKFGRICLLQHRKRTLVYLIPERDSVGVAIVLGERACKLAMASSIPAKIKRMLAEARPYVEGRGIRFLVKSTREASVVTKLVEIKTTPK